MTNELSYQRLHDKHVLILESMDIALLILDKFIRLARMSGVIIPEESFPNYWIKDGLARIVRENKVDFAAIHVPSTANTAEIAGRLSQVSLLDPRNTVILAGVPSSNANFEMYESFKNMGFSLVNKSNPLTIISAFANMLER